MKIARGSVKFNFEKIEHDIVSGNQETRGSAMQALLMQSRKDASIHAQALKIFRQSLVTVPDAWTAISAARGIELLADPDEGRQAWLALLHHRDSSIVAHVAQAITHPSYVPVLLEILTRRPEISVKTSAIRTLGRLHDSAALGSLTELLSVPELRPHAIQALEDLGDDRAIAHLEPLLADSTDVWKEDNHGPVLRVSDLAGAAIRRLRIRPGQNTDHDLKQTTEHLPHPTLPPPIPPDTYAQISLSAPSPSSVSTYIPLVAALLEIPWIGLLIIGQLYLTGQFRPSPIQARILSALAILPAVVGLFAGITVIVTRRPARLIDRFLLGIGFSICGFIILWLGQELVR